MTTCFGVNTVPFSTMNYRKCSRGVTKFCPNNNHHHPSSTNKTNIGLDHLVDKSPSSRPVSQIGFERVISSTTDKHKSELEQRQSTYTGEENRHKYILEGEKLPYGNGASALIDMPVVSPPKRVNSQVGLVEMPSLPPRNTERSASPSPSSPISTNPYARQNSRERQTDISGTERSTHPSVP